MKFAIRKLRQGEGKWKVCTNPVMVIVASILYGVERGARPINEARLQFALHPINEYVRLHDSPYEWRPAGSRTLASPSRPGPGPSPSPTRVAPGRARDHSRPCPGPGDHNPDPDHNVNLIREEDIPHGNTCFPGVAPSA